MDIKTEFLKEVKQHEEYLDSECKTGYSIEIVGVELSGIDLSNRHLSGADLVEIKFNNAKFTNAELYGCLLFSSSFNAQSRHGH